MEKVSYKRLQGNWKQDCKPEKKGETFCRDLKLKRETVFKHFIRKKICFSHEYDKVIITYNFDNDNINTEEEKKFFEKYFEESELLENGWLISEESFGYKTYCEGLDFENNFDFMLERHRGSAHCNCIP